MAALVVVLLLLPARALRLELEEGGTPGAAESGALAAAKLPGTSTGLARADSASETQAWGESDYDQDSDHVSDTVDLLSWTAIINQARVAPGFGASLSVSEKNAWMMTFPLWLRRTGPADYSGCPPFPAKGVYVALSARGELCFSGRGFLSRAASTFAMFQEAGEVLRARGQFPRPFGPKSIGIGDTTLCQYDMGYSTQFQLAQCGMRLIPDFNFWKFPEAGLLPNFTVLSKVVEQLGRSPAEEEKCGWIGSPATHKIVLPSLEEAVRNDSSFAVLHWDDWEEGLVRLSMEEQASKWACLIDVPCQGYSGRVPLLLHTGRPVIMIERMSSPNRALAVPTGSFVDNTWYGQFMEPWVHYIPLYANFSNLKNVTRVALGEEGRVIGRNAVEMARKKLTTEAAIQAMADVLLAMQGDDPSPA